MISAPGLVLDPPVLVQWDVLRFHAAKPPHFGSVEVYGNVVGHEIRRLAGPHPLPARGNSAPAGEMSLDNSF